MITKKYINQMPCVGLNYFEQVNCKNQYETEKLTLAVYFKNEELSPLHLRSVSVLWLYLKNSHRDMHQNVFDDIGF